MSTDMKLKVSQTIVTEQKKKIQELTARIQFLENKLYQGRECGTYEDWHKSTDKLLSAYLDMMGAAFAKEINVNPLKCVLNVALPNDGKELQYWFGEEHEECKYKEKFI